MDYWKKWRGYAVYLRLKLSLGRESDQPCEFCGRKSLTPTFYDHEVDVEVMDAPAGMHEDALAKRVRKHIGKTVVCDRGTCMDLWFDRVDRKMAEIRYSTDPPPE